ncbi:hypothetical protein E2P81_ATG06351 [Venturia nashicola]|uniref:Uncharacterized protein n=1 Tax=Venturia nashicola TaxID=86259 RepID=A0A4Z1P2U0_9PEZI|nr:hypothetical protein E6O75_ATG06506 [Venturia nashicola]TLD28005.1 hypothetical protein E2P81_ATG06351 [Venturia nashicola]
MASNPPGDALNEKDQPHLTTTSFSPEQQEVAGQLEIKPVVSKGANKSDKTKKHMEQKAASKERPGLMLSTHQKERTKAWVETQIVPGPLPPVAEVATPDNAPKQTGTEKNAEARKSTMVNLTTTPAKETTLTAPTTYWSPIPMIRKGPGLTPRSAEFVELFRKCEEAEIPRYVNPNISPYSLEIRGEAAFNRGEFGGRIVPRPQGEWEELFTSSPVRRPLPTPGPPRRAGKNVRKPKVDKEG